LETHEKPLIINIAGKRLVKNGPARAFLDILADDSVQGVHCTSLAATLQKTGACKAMRDAGGSSSATSIRARRWTCC
jgi:hypothetical protein